MDTESEALVCTACQTLLRCAARFCDACGVPVSQDRSAEYKQVTVLFADVVGSMNIAAQVGAERLREIMAELVDLAAAIVRRYDGTLDKFTGDGIMAIFGAPVALEDHAARACWASVDIQDAISTFGQAVARHDGISLGLRIGLCSGRVITGEIGSAATGYTAIGEQVGLARRMESAAPPGGVLLSASTARLVEGRVLLGAPQTACISGTGRPVTGQQLLSMADGRRSTGVMSSLVGREREVTALEEIVRRVQRGCGSAVAVVGPAGIGKSRLVAEAMAQAKQRGCDVFATACESHATGVPFGVVARLLRALWDVRGLDGATARARVRDQIPDADPVDALMLHDLLGIAQSGTTLPEMDPDARRRRLTALINSAALERNRPALFVIEDVHWIDEGSESMFAEILAEKDRGLSVALLTYRPEYRGLLRDAAGISTITLGALSESEMSALVQELVGTDPSVTVISQVISQRAAGNPFFAEEIVRELAEQQAFVGGRGRYVCTAAVETISVPPTLQATLGARIDRLRPAGKQTLCAASVVGSRFSARLLDRLGVDAGIAELLTAELLEVVDTHSGIEYVIRHPLIRAVAYESQLNSDRAQMHQRVATAIETGDRSIDDANAALIAEHLEAAGDLEQAYDWHMRAGWWAINRDTAAVRVSSERACKIADALPGDDPVRLAMRIAPRMTLCRVAERLPGDIAFERFEELQLLCAAAKDTESLFIAMAGLMKAQVQRGRISDGARVAKDTAELIESIEGATVCAEARSQTVSTADAGASGSAAWWALRPIAPSNAVKALRDNSSDWSLALAFAQRASVRYWLGREGWRDDLARATGIAQGADAGQYATVVASVYMPAIPAGVLVADPHVLDEIEDARQSVESCSEDLPLELIRVTLAIALLHCDDVVDRDRGFTLLTGLSGNALCSEYVQSRLPIAKAYSAREQARRGAYEPALSILRSVVEDQFGLQQGFLSWAAPATGLLVESLLSRGHARDVAEADAAVARLAASPVTDGAPVREIWLTRLAAMAAEHRGDLDQYGTLVARYRRLSEAAGFTGHTSWANQMSPPDVSPAFRRTCPPGP